MSKNNRRGLVEKPDLSVLGPIREIIRLVEEGKRSKSQLQAFVEGHNPFDLPSPVGIHYAITILGAKKVITKQQAYSAFGFSRLFDGTTIRYTEETLRECAALNHSDQADWRLIYALPLSLLEQRKAIGVDRKNQPCFFNNEWWLGDKDVVWTSSHPMPDYYLIDFKGRFNRANWETQSALISEMGELYERADERVFSQALISIFKAHGERLFSDGYHWGRFEDSYGDRVCIGFFSGGLGVDRSDRSYSGDENMFACVSRKFDF